MDTIAIHEAITPWQHEEWRDWAACKNADTSIFFETIPVVAESMCSVCPVQVECLDYAMRENIHDGMWGGKSEKDRRVLRRRQFLDLNQLLDELGYVFDEVSYHLAETM